MPSVNPGPASSQSGQTAAVMAPFAPSPANPFPQGTAALRLLAFKQGVNANVVGDTPMDIINSSAWTAATVVLSNASISLTTAAAGIFTAPAAGGTAIRANAALAALTGPTVTNAAAAAAAALALKATGQTIYVNVATAQGAPATFDVYVYGYDLTPVSYP
jgi:hypothetical protein